MKKKNFSKVKKPDRYNERLLKTKRGKGDGCSVKPPRFKDLAVLSVTGTYQLDDNLTHSLWGEVDAPFKQLDSFFFLFKD
jgi:hypothetical protein